VPDYRAGLRLRRRELRVAIPDGRFGGELDPEVATAFADARSLLAAVGCRLVPVALPSFDRFNALRRLVMLVEVAALHRERVESNYGAFNPQTVARMEPGYDISAVDYARALSARAPMLRAFCAEVFAEADLLALPTCAATTPGIAETETGGDPRFIALANRLGTLVGPFNYLGLPALSMPMGLDARGMPMGLQLVGRPYAEAMLLRVACSLEEAAGPLPIPPAARI
jgi:aspartyl-tRNA(Asn)/glutamyl-tRNA(Gln) amidotransferase subunit A